MKYRIVIDGLLSEFAGGEGVLLDLTRKRYHLLNPTAGFIWTALEKEPLTEDALADALVARYQIEPDRARRTAEQFASQLVDMGLVEASK